MSEAHQSCVNRKHKTGAVLSGLIVFFLLFGTGCDNSQPSHSSYSSPPPTPAVTRAQAIRRVLARDMQCSNSMRTQLDQGGDVYAVARYAQTLQTLDLRGCPPEFQEAYLRHANAWTTYANILVENKDRYNGDLGFVTAIVEGLANTYPVQQELSYANSVIAETWIQVKMAALQYNVNVGQ